MRFIFAAVILVWAVLGVAAEFPTKPPARTPKEAISRLLAAEMHSDLARLGRIVKQAGIRSD